MVNAGRILIMARGVWTNLENYQMLDLVTRDGIAYLARQASVGVDPKTDSAYTYWQPFGSATLPDSATIVYNEDNELTVSLDGETLVYDETNEVIKVNIDGSTIKYDSNNGLYAETGKVLTQTLAVGETTLTFTDASIGNNSLIDVYTNVYGVNPKTMTQSGTTVGLTFKAQSVAVSVKLVVKNN